MKKRIFCLVLSLCLLFGALPVSATETPVTSGTVGTGGYWNFSNGTLTITGSGDIPDFTFLSLAPWKHLQESITAVEIGNGITRIGDDAFSQYHALQRVSIGTGVQSIGQRAFQLCTALQEVTIPSSVGYIESSAFDNCEAMTSLTIENGLVSIGNSAFSDNYALKSVTIPDSVTTMGSYCFNNCTSLESLVLGDGLTAVSSHAFHGCKALKTVEFGANLESIGQHAFWECYALTNFSLPDKLKLIDIWAFFHCTSLTELTIPGSVTTIGESAFNGCTGIKNLTIQDGVTTISTNAFKGCTGISKLVLPDSVTYLGTSAFNGCKALETASLGSGLTAIGKYAFQDCEALTKVTMGDNVTTIGYEAFYGCHALKSINLSEKLVTIEGRAFWVCNSLERISFPESLKTIGEYAFSDCNSLKKLTIPGTVETVGNFAFTGCKNLETVEIEEGVLTIGNGAFQNCSKLGMDLDPDSPLSFNYVTIPDSVTYLGKQAFSGCTLMEDISLGEGITEIGYHTFNDCKSLDSVLIPDSVVTVGSNVFTGCENLRFVSFGKKVETIGSQQFTGAKLVNSIWFRGDAPVIDDKAFLPITANATYYAGNATWTDEKKQNYGGTITWLANWSEDFINDDLTVDQLNERYIRITPYAREGEAGVGRKLTGVTYQSSAEPLEIFGYTSIARNEAGSYGITLRAEGFQEYVIPAMVAASFQGTGGKAYELTALMKKLPLFGKNDPYVSTIFGRNHGTGECYTELRSNRLVLSPYVSQDLVITVRNFSAQDILYTIGVPGKLSQQLSSRNGVFTAEYLHNLAVNTNTLYVWAQCGSTGEKTDPIPIYFSKAATSTELENQLKSGKISLFGDDGLKLSLGNSGLFKDVQFDLDNFEVPVGLYLSGNTLKVSLGLDIYESGDDEDEANTKWNTLKKYVNQRQTRRKKVGEAVEAFDQWYDEMQSLAKAVGTPNLRPFPNTASKDFDFTIGAMGYAEYQYSNGQWVLVDGTLGVDGEFKLSHEVQAFVGTPPIWPVYGGIEGKAEVEVTGHALRSVPDKYSPMRFDILLGITPEISIHAGVGLKDAASGGLYGAGSLPINMEFSHRHLTISAKGEIGAEAEIFGTVHQKVLLESEEILLLDKYFGASARAVAMDMGTERTVTTILSRDYAKNTSQWLGGRNSGTASAQNTDSVAAKGITYRNLQESIFSNTQPQLVSVGKNLLLVWSEDCAQRDLYNRMRMVYSVYDSAADSWSEPAPVWDDGCNDGYARLVSDGGNVWLLWQKAKTLLTAETAPDIAFIHANTELCLARFDAASGTFVDAQMITDNSTYEYAHHIHLENGNPSILWASAQDNALNGAGTHSIHGWKGGNGEVLADSLNYILSIDAMDGEITYVSDGDGDLSTTGDITAFTMTGSGTTAYGNSAGRAVTYAAYGSLNGVQTLFVGGMRGLHYLQDGQWKPVLSEGRNLGGNIQIVETPQGTTILWTEATKGGNALYSVRYSGGSWSEPVQISGGDQILSRISAVCHKGTLTGVCNVNAVTLDSATGSYAVGETNLCFFQANDFSDIALNYTLPVDEGALHRGADAGLQVSVTNQGTVNVSSLTFTLTDTLGTQVKQTVAVDLPSGESRIVDLTYPVPENYAATTLTITAEAAATDLDPQDNTITLELGKCDLALSDAAVEFLDDGYLIKAIVENKSLVDAENVTLELRMDEADSAPFLMKNIQVISRENYAVINVFIPAQAVYFDRYGLGYVYITLNTSGADAAEGDNTILLVIEEPLLEAAPVLGMKGDLNLDDQVDAEDLTLLARHVAGISLLTGQALDNCDVNSDGIVDANDLTMHARYVAGIIADWEQA